MIKRMCFHYLEWCVYKGRDMSLNRNACNGYKGNERDIIVDPYVRVTGLTVISHT